MAVTKSGVPSPLRSDAARVKGTEPTANAVAFWKVPSPFPGATQTLPLVSATAASSFPSPSKSANTAALWPPMKLP